jgi:hypothetical protein
MKIYFIYDGTKHEGPFTIEELKAKGIKRSTFVWKEGLPSWVTADQVEELEYILPPLAQPPTPPPSVVETVQQVEQIKTTETTPQQTQQSEQKKVQAAPVKEKFSIAEEPKPAAKSQQTQVQKNQSGAPKNKNKVVLWIVGAVVVLGGGGAGYYYYFYKDKNQNANDGQLNRNIFQKDTSGFDNNARNSNVVSTQISDTTKSNVTNNNKASFDSAVVKNENAVSQIDKSVKTDNKTDQTIAKQKNKNLIPFVKKPKTEKNVVKKEPSVKEVKSINPLDYLSISGGYKKNLFREAVLEGKIHNSGPTPFKNIVIEVRLLSSSGEVLKTQQFTKANVLAPGNDMSFKFKTGPPKDTRSATYKIISAVPAQ